MDIHAWLHATEDRRPPDDLSPARARELSHRRSRERSHDLRAKLARQGLDREHSTEIGYDVDAQAMSKYARGDDQAQHRRRRRQRQVHSISSEAYEIVDIGRYDRKPRRKTRIDLYEPKAKSTRGDVPKISRLGATKTAREAAKAMEGREKNAGSKRLTLKPDAKFGLYRHGRSSGQVPARRTGLPDLVFNEMKFLQDPVQITNQDQFALEEIEETREDHQRVYDGVVSAFFRGVGRPEQKVTKVLRRDNTASEQHDDPPELCNVRHKRGYIERSAEVDIEVLTRSSKARNVDSNSLAQLHSFEHQGGSDHHSDVQQVLKGLGQKSQVQHDPAHMFPQAGEQPERSRLPLNTDGALSLFRAGFESTVSTEQVSTDKIQKGVTTTHAAPFGHSYQDLDVNAARLSRDQTDVMLDRRVPFHSRKRPQARPYESQERRTSDSLNLARHGQPIDQTDELRLSDYVDAEQLSGLSAKKWAERYLRRSNSAYKEEQQLRCRFEALNRDLAFVDKPLTDATMAQQSRDAMPVRGLVSFDTAREPDRKQLLAEPQPSACRIRLWHTEQDPSMLNDSAVSICQSRSPKHANEGLTSCATPIHTGQPALQSIEASILSEENSNVCEVDGVSKSGSRRETLFSESAYMSNERMQIARPFSRANYLY